MAIPDPFALQVIYNVMYRLKRGFAQTRVVAEDPTRIETHYLEVEDFLLQVGVGFEFGLGFELGFGRELEVAYGAMDWRIKDYGFGAGVVLGNGRRGAEHTEEKWHGIARRWRVGGGNESCGAMRNAVAVHSAEISRQRSKECEEGVRAWFSVLSISDWCSAIFSVVDGDYLFCLNKERNTCNCLGCHSAALQTG